MVDTNLFSATFVIFLMCLIVRALRWKIWQAKFIFPPNQGWFPPDRMLFFLSKENPPIRSDFNKKNQVCKSDKKDFSCWADMFCYFLGFVFVGALFSIRNQHVSPPFAEFVLLIPNHILTTELPQKSSNKNGWRMIRGSRLIPENSLMKFIFTRMGFYKFTWWVLPPGSSQLQ